MSAKRWLVMFLAAVVLAVGACTACNILVDPFGVFGDPLLDWYSYNETNNPRVAKIAWLEKHSQDYDSYVIGSSSAASYSVEELNQYLDARFYNLFVYGCDTQDYVDFAAYLLERCTVKNLVLNLGINEANAAHTAETSFNDQMHPLAAGGSQVAFYLRHAFCTTRFSLEKLSSRLQDTDLPQVFDVFDAPSGCYDKRVRDVEKIGDPDLYQAAHGNEFRYFGETDLLYVGECVQAVAAIRDMCAEKGVRLIVIASPVYAAQWNACGEAALRRYQTALAEVVDYWDFACTPVSYDSRYFYDVTHFRNCVGTMVLAEIFGNEDVYRPQGFGAYVTADTCAAYLDSLFAAPPEMEEALYTAHVPVLAYQVSPETLEAHIRALSDAGYQAVSFQAMVDYVTRGGSLPEHPVCITVDNVESVRPILEHYGMWEGVYAASASAGEEPGDGILAVACPDGLYDTAFEVRIHQSGVPVTLAAGAEGRSILVRGLPQSLYALRQWTVTDDTAAEELLLRLGM